MNYLQRCTDDQEIESWVKRQNHREFHGQQSFRQRDYHRMFLAGKLPFQTFVTLKAWDGLTKLRTQGFKIFMYELCASMCLCTRCELGLKVKNITETNCT